MFVEFQNLSNSSRIWIYGSDKIISEDIQKIIGIKFKDFLNNWYHHGKPLTASFDFLHNRFLVIAVNEKYNPIGGCSIDYSLQLVKDISKTIDNNLLDRLINFSLSRS